MLRRFFSIAFLSLLLISGSGIGYLFSMHLARTNARRFESEISNDANAFERIVLSVDQFNSLPKENISSSIFEISYQNRRFDIYKTEFTANTVVLFARHDKQEEQIFKNIADANNTNNLNKESVPFYGFHFFLHDEEIFKSPVALYKHELFSLNLIFTNYSSIPSPPPDHVFA